MINTFLSTLIFIGLPLGIALAGFSFLRRRGRGPFLAGCGSIVVGLVVTTAVIVAITLAGVL